MQAVSKRPQLWLIGIAYAAIIGFAAVSFHARYVWYEAHPGESMASSGMYAAGDTLLAAFVTILLLVPTIFLLRLVSREEANARISAKLMLALGLSAPLSLFLFRLGAETVPELLFAGTFFRLAWSPFVLILIIAGRVLARFPQPRRLLNYALLAEAGTLALSLALILFAWPTSNR